MKGVAITVNGMNGIGINATNGIANATQEKFIHALKKVTKEMKWMTSFRRAFCPTIEEQIEDLENALRIHNEAIEKKWCSTCKYWTPPPEGTPGFVEDHGYCDFGYTVDLTPNCSDYGLDEEGETAEFLKIRNELDRLKIIDEQPSDR